MKVAPLGLPSSLNRTIEKFRLSLPRPTGLSRHFGGDSGPQLLLLLLLMLFMLLLLLLLLLVLVLLLLLLVLVLLLLLLFCCCCCCCCSCFCCCCCCCCCCCSCRRPLLFFGRGGGSVSLFKKYNPQWKQGTSSKTPAPPFQCWRPRLGVFQALFKKYHLRPKPSAHESVFPTLKRGFKGAVHFQASLRWYFLNNDTE